MLKFKVQLPGQVTITYTGFRPFAKPRQLIEGRVIVIAWVEGDTEIWVVEGEAGITELRRFYHDTHGRTNVILTRLIEVASADFHLQD